MEILRIGDKLISWSRIQYKLERILEMRSRGASQQEVAEKMGIDRTFISRLEGLGEIRKGKNVGIVGFPIMNKDEIMKVLDDYGITRRLLLSEKERVQFIQKKSGLELFNQLLELIGEFRNLDTVVVMASDKRIELIQDLLDNQVVPLAIGMSPITEDIYVKPELLRTVLDALTGEEE